MKFSELWLREWVNTTLNSKALLNQITMAGLEVDSVEPVASRFCGVVIGEVVACNQHPNTNNLLAIKVNIGDNRLLNIFCDAQNCRQKLKVAVATVGAVLPDNFKIKTMELQGMISEGILCSYSILGISDEHNSIIELPADAPIGTDIRKYLQLDDNTIEINVTPNRADCLCIIGLARDVAALNKTNLNIQDITQVKTTINDILPIKVEATNVCPRYLGRIIKNINIKALTPLWMKEKLRRCGIRSIDAVVDVTNYVLLELGQPIHAIDKDRIDGGIVVRMAKKNEIFVLPNESEVKLNTDTVVIADHSKVLAMGGIFSGKHAVINYETKNVLLGCAFFSPIIIASCARHYNIHTDASYRYERGVDPDLQHKAIERATRLLIHICNGEAGPIIDVTNEVELPKRVIITLRRSKLDRLIGYHINDELVSDILLRLGCNVTKGHNWWQVIAPSWRFDIKIEEDLVEEIARVYGYNNIPGKPVQASLLINSNHKIDLSIKRVKSLLNDKGYQEVITYSFVDPKVQQLIHPNKKALILSNPISKEMSVMRLSLWTGLLKTIIYNQNRQQNHMRIFETGLCFVPNYQAKLNISQDMMLAGAVCGNRHEEHWDLEKVSVDFYDIKGDIESILDLTGKLSEVKFYAQVIPALHPGQSAAIYLKEEHIGFIGVIHPEIEYKLDLNSRTIVFELDWNKIANRIIPQAKDISCFPANRRDITIIVPENIQAADVLAECKKVNVNQVVGVNLFDVYHGVGIAEGFKSLTISLILQDTSRTLEEKEITATVTKCVDALKERFQASLRD